jgi:hypothetical protein
MIAGAPNEISGLESDLDVCFFQKKGGNALEAFDHWPSSTIQLRNHSFSPRIPAKPGFQCFNEGLDSLDTWTELQSCIYHDLHPEIRKQCQGTTVGTL